VGRHDAKGFCGMGNTTLRPSRPEQAAGRRRAATFSASIDAASQTLILQSIDPYREWSPADALSSGTDCKKRGGNGMA
jgi:hypothetical protein